jgi:hypothetical protein
MGLSRPRHNPRRRSAEPTILPEAPALEFRSPASLRLDPDEDAAFAEDGPRVGRDEEGGLVRGQTLG